MLVYSRRLFFFVVLFLVIFIQQLNAQAPNPLPARDHDVAILVVDDFGDPFALDSPAEATSFGVDCLLLHSLDSSTISPTTQLPQASRSLGMATFALGMISSPLDINTVPHGQFVFTQFADFSDSSAYDDLDLENWVLNPYLNGASFERFTYPPGHALSGTIATNPNQIEFSGYDLIPVHADGDNADSLHTYLTDAISRTVALGYTDIVVNMSFGYFKCDEKQNYINNPNVVSSNVENSDFHIAIQAAIADYPATNIVFVGASGNFSKNSPFAPAVWDEVISVDAYQTIDTVATLSARELFLARRDKPFNNFANVGSVLMPDTWGDIHQDNTLINTSPTSVTVRFQGTSFATPYLSMYLAQFFDSGGQTCNGQSLVDQLTVNWDGSVTSDEIKGNLETIVRKNTCPDLYAPTYITATKKLSFTTYLGSPSMSLSITIPTMSSSTINTDDIEVTGFVYDANAGTGNGAGVDIGEIKIYPGTICGGVSWWNPSRSSSMIPISGLDNTYADNTFTIKITRPDGVYNFTTCAESSLTGSHQVSETVTITVEYISPDCTGTNFPISVATPSQLIHAIECANQISSSVSEINLENDIALVTANNSIDGSNGLPSITSTIVINGNGHSIERASSAVETFRIFHISSTGDLTLNNIVIKNGSAQNTDEAIDFDRHGGGILNHDGDLTLYNSVVASNEARDAGGGIYSRFGETTIRNSYIQGNIAQTGVGIHNSGGVLSILNTIISGNFGYGIGGGGGGIGNEGVASIHSSTIVGNSTKQSGGGITSDGTLTLSNSIVWGNYAASEGQQLYHFGLYGGTMTIKASGIENGQAGVGMSGTITYNPNNITLNSAANIFINSVRADGSNTPNVAGNYHLNPSVLNPVVNEGDNTLATNAGLTTDIDGDTRISLGIVDMGADEVIFALPPEDTNLIYNPGFTLGVNKDAGWKFYGTIQHSVTNGLMNLTHGASVNGWMRQFRTIYPLPMGSPMEAKVDLANPNATAKTVHFMVRDSGLAETYLCTFSLPANAPLRTYTMRFKVNLLDWEIIRIDLSPTTFGDNGIKVDNVNLQYKPSLSVPVKVCIDPVIPPLPPYNTNLIYNPGFDIGGNGLSGWRSGGSIISSVTGGVLKLNFPGVVDGWFHQFRTIYPLRAGLVMNAWVTVSNTDSVAKSLQFMMRDSDYSNTYLCTFNVPANSNNLVYSMRFRTLTDWEIIRADMRVATVDTAGLYFDNVNLRYQPWQSLSGNQQCFDAVPDEAPPPPPDTELVLTE